MPFDNRIRELCAELEHCDDDARALELLQELQSAIHERVEQIRGEVKGITLIQSNEAKGPPRK